METNGIKFGFGVVQSGQRKAAYDPELAVLTTHGGFRITPQVSKALGIANGDYVMFINNFDQIDAAARAQADVVVDYCNQNGLDITDPATLDTLHEVFGQWAIAKGIKAYSDKGVVLKVVDRMSKKEKEAAVAANFDAALEAAMASDDAELKDAVSAEGLTRDQQIEILAAAMAAPEVDKYLGSKCANASDMIGTGVVLNFTDSNIWNILKADLRKEVKTSVIRSYPIDLTQLDYCEVNNGYEKVRVPYLPISKEFVDTTVSPRGQKA